MFNVHYHPNPGDPPSLRLPLGDGHASHAAAVRWAEDRFGAEWSRHVCVMFAAPTEAAALRRGLMVAAGMIPDATVETIPF